MANNAEIVLWVSGVYQFETSDPIQGGVGGVDNLPHISLGNRTLFLKSRQDAMAAQCGLTPDNSDQQQSVACAQMHVPTIPAMRALPVPQVASNRSVVIMARGGAADGDGNGAMYRWSSTSNAADDGLNTLTPSTNPATGRWLLLGLNPSGLNASKLNGQSAVFYTNAANLSSGQVAAGRLGGGTPSTATYLRGDLSWQPVDAVTLGGNAPTFYTNAANISSGVLAPARHGTGAPTAATWLRGDGTWTAVDAATFNGQNAAFYLNASSLNAGTVPTGRLGGGSANASVYLRGDSQWSQVDAITLAGQGAAFFQNASNLNAGIVADARISASSVTQHQGSLTTRNISGKTGISKTLSASGPSGGSDGDIWYQF